MERIRAMLKPARFIYFDLGNVLLHFDHGLACRQMSEVAGISAQRVREVVFEAGLQQRYETGDISSREFYDIFCEQTRTQPDYQALHQAGSAIFELNVRILPIVTHLRAARHRLGILSNTCEAHWNYVSGGRFAMIPEMFDVCVLSFRVGSMKPSAKIYSAAVDLAQVGADEIFFTDDRVENVTAAKQVGLDAMLYSSPLDLATALHHRGVEFNY